MKTLVSLFVGLSVIGTLAAQLEPAGLRLRIELSDGSRIVGQPVSEQLACQTEFGPIRASWDKVRMVEFLGGTNQCRLRLANGDHIQARFEAGPFILDTLLGKLTLPNHALVKIEVFDPRQLPEGLVLHYNFENIEADEVPDLSGNGHHGRVVEAKLVTRLDKSQAIGFDGRRGAVTMGNPSKLHLQEFTIGCWVRRANRQVASFHPGGGGTFVSYGKAGYFFGMASDGQLVLSEVDGAISKRAAPDIHVTDEEWHHLAVTKQGREVVFYLDGTPHKSNGLETTFLSNTPVAIGSIGGNLSGGVFLGSLDEVMIFNRCLPAEDINRIYGRTK